MPTVRNGDDQRVQWKAAAGVDEYGVMVALLVLAMLRPRPPALASHRALDRLLSRDPLPERNASRGRRRCRQPSVARAGCGARAQRHPDEARASYEASAVEGRREVLPRSSGCSPTASVSAAFADKPSR